MRTLSRRQFTGLAAASPLLSRGADLDGAMPTRLLGKTGFRASILGLGAGHFTGKTFEQSIVDRTVAEGIEHGLNYIDTARGYVLSEERLGRALKGRRDKVFLVTKTRSHTREAAAKDLRESLRNLQTDYLDCVLIHNISREERFPNFEETLSEKGALGALLEARKQGMIRHIGCSAHTHMARVLRAFQTGEIALFMPILNFVERHIYDFEAKVLPEARRRNIAIVAMKVLGGAIEEAGARLASAEDYSNSMRFVWGVPGVAVTNIGMRSPEELRQALAAAKAYKPLSAAESKALAERGKRLASEWGPLRGPVS